MSNYERLSDDYFNQDNLFSHSLHENGQHVHSVAWTLLVLDV